MLWDDDKLIQEYSDNHVFTTVYDQASFVPVARLVWLREQTINEQVSEQDKDWLAKFNDKERETRVNLREIPNFYDDYVKKDKLEDILSIKVYYYHNDQLGIPNELTDDKGQVVWLADYAAWGNISKEAYQSQAIGDFEISAEELQPIRFQGQSLDSETGLHYNRFRYYDPDIGMFISRDPIGLMGGDNVFAYAPNPTGWIDPLGLTAGVIGCAAGPAGCAVGIGGSFVAALILGAGATVSGDTPKEKTTTDTSCTSCQPCPECTPFPRGTVGYIGPKTSVRGADGTRSGTGNEHYILYKVGQDSRTCRCYWKEDKKIAGHHYPTQPNIALTINLNPKISGNTRAKYLPYP